ncbi:lipopolysaccharide assembly protein LapA domain-containing protein [Evansella sp. AB-P1]|uniref:LapA family protein n=1 Tax=Evansella sp. AB-P1 TaxID=3037653 RepID=UPI00241C2436|nr:lipopolysaccharide assembly protein LapA domain-containing protein [Evansella sp. AB-P1]MDG5786447.1 lipopolysaccharide assembly protein LapA domain-containing protein [Evansella sp. AB-P1]
MRGQWTLIVGIIVALIIAVFAVINVDPVEVNYIFGQNEWPLVLVILVSVLMGGLIVGSVGMYKLYKLQQEVKTLRKKLGEGQSTSASVNNTEGKNGKKNGEISKESQMSKPKQDKNA